MEDHSIDRADLDSPTTEPNSPDPILQSYFRQQLQQRYADPSQTLTTNNGAEVDSTRGSATEQVQPDQEDAYDFRLFTRPSNSGLASIGKSSAPQRITLKSPSPAAGGLDPESGGRPDTYYFTGDTGSELAEQYARAAVSGEDVDEGLKMRWVCCSYAPSRDSGLNQRHRRVWSCHGESASSRPHKLARWWWG